MRSLCATLALLTLVGCTVRPKSASGPTLPWDTVGTPYRKGPPRSMLPAAGQWMGELPAADAAARRFTLVLGEDYSAMLFTEFEGKGTITEKGTWSADGPAVTVLLMEHDGKPINTFLAYDLNGRMLVPAAGWDSTLWGANGPPALQKR
ncbi:MAG TPA: hypothetical protein VFY20_03335 [Gemmatimonadales bacterium]|nr:hypothetical protein [Gemmatimonadales bacterium]